MPPHRKSGHKSKRVKMNGVHMNGDDWSDDDDDGVKSGSATGFSEAEVEEGTPKKMFPKKYDPVNMLLDRIDAELSSLTKSQSSSATGSTVIQKPGSGRSSESNHDELTTSQLEHSDGSSSRPGNRSGMNGEGPGLDPRKIHGTVEIYSDAANMTDGDDLQRPSAPSDLDSLAAQQVDQKFKAILRKKKGGYLENLRASYPPSETDTIRTEDYEQRFRNAMVYSSDDSETLENNSDVDAIDTADYLADMHSDGFDTTPNKGAVNKNETIPEEDCETQPQRMITLHSNTIGSGSNPHSDQRDVNESPKRKHRSRQQPYPSDAESVKTEDFEVRFQELLIKTQESGMDTGLESDINDPLHRKVQAILKVSSPYKGKSQKKLNGYHDNTGIRMTKPDLDNRRRQNYGKQNRMTSAASLNDSYFGSDSWYKSIYEDSDTVQFKDYEMPVDNFKSLRMSSTSSSGTGASSMSSWYPSASGQQTPSSSLSYANSLSSLLIGDIGESCSDIQSPLISPQFKPYNPLMEKLFEDSITIKRMNLMAPIDNSFDSGHNLYVDDGKEKGSGEDIQYASKHRELILPEEEEEFPFAKYTFNKKPDESKTCSSSDVSSESQESVKGNMDNSSFFGHKCSTLQKKVSSNWTSSSKSFLSEDSSAPPDATASTPSHPTPAGPRHGWNQYVLDSESTKPHPVQPFYDSSNHFGMPSNSMYYPPYSQNIPDQILFNLGFNEGPEQFLPDRFMQDWYKKIHKAKLSMIQQQQLERQMDFSLPGYEADKRSVDSFDYELPTRKNMPQSGWHAMQTNLHNQNLQNCSQFSKSFDIGPNSSQVSVQEGQCSINKLRYMLQNENKHLNNSNSPISLKDVRRKQYASNRQKSLPAYLETLTEEDEIIRKKRCQKHTPTMQQTLSKESLDSYHILEALESPELCTSKSQTDLKSKMSDLKSFDQNVLQTSLESKLRVNTQNSEMKRGSKFRVPCIMINEMESESCDKNLPSSNDSLEVLDIFTAKSNKDHSCQHNLEADSKLQVEPAMVSVVLQDVESQKEGNKPKQLCNSTVNQNVSADLLDDKLLLPTTPLSVSSSSPAPMSPVTVIEVNLDNQSDSLDTDDCNSQNTSLEKDFCFQEANISMNSSFGTTPQDSRMKTASETKITKSKALKKSPNVDGRKSPIPTYLMNHDDIQSTEQDKSMMVSDSSTDACIQADDGTLAPLIKFSYLDDILKQLTSAEHQLFYLAEDKEIQCDLGAKDFTCNLNGLLSFDYICELPCASSSRKHSFNLPPQANEIRECKDKECQVPCGDMFLKNETSVNRDCHHKSFRFDDDADSRTFYPDVIKEFCTSSNSQSETNCDKYARLQTPATNPRYTPLKVTLDRLEKKAKNWICKDTFPKGDK